LYEITIWSYSKYKCSTPPPHLCRTFTTTVATPAATPPRLCHASATLLPHFCHTFATLYHTATPLPHDLCLSRCLSLVTLATPTTTTTPLLHLCRTFAAHLFRCLYLFRSRTLHHLSFVHVCAVLSLSVSIRHSIVTPSPHVSRLCHTCATPVPHLRHTWHSYLSLFTRFLCLSFLSVSRPVTLSHTFFAASLRATHPPLPHLCCHTNTFILIATRTCATTLPHPPNFAIIVYIPVSCS
jgi:hypothetical protein